MSVAVRECELCGTSIAYRGRGRPRRYCLGCEESGEKKRAYREANRDSIAEKQRAYREANRDSIAEKKRAYYEANRDSIAEKKRAYYEANRDSIAEKQRAYREANRDSIAEKQRAYREANRDSIAEKQRAYREGLTCSECGAPTTRIEQGLCRKCERGEIPAGECVVCGDPLAFPVDDHTCGFCREEYGAAVAA
jgi:hypothetical protein